MKPELERTPMPDVKNCPFCGKEPKLVDMYPSLVECETPGCILEYETFRVAAWNHRPEEDRLRKSSHSVSQCCPMSERLQKRVEELEAIVARLPKTADGVPITTGMKVWRINTRDAGKTWYVTEHITKEIVDFHGDPCCAIEPECDSCLTPKPVKGWHSTSGHNRFYSTREAAAEASAKGVKS